MKQERNLRRAGTEPTASSELCADSADIKQEESARQGALPKENVAEKIRSLLHQLGLRSTYNGFRYLAYAIELAYTDDTYLRRLTGSLYPAVAQEFQSTTAAVARSLRTLLSAFWMRGNRELFDSIAGYQMKDKPSAGEFIDILAVYIRNS